ncbi:amidohydrolase family protein [Sanguibacter sp. 4.1]|uniref:Amidohydrolase family protein n=1 Tax=Sanguibacter biliveldensis TaxID=3030830 RepID=A0AAF1BZI8_9MICO|nr:amidohydrolase family protein [Sanguibacter sp. 4.1]WPF83162.1 amidohydrolase family protein [Sanguibacter sp. 4.1]
MTASRVETVVHGVRLPDASSTTGLTEPVDLHLGRRVIAVSPAGRRPTGVDVLDGDGRVALPGLVDAHVHGEAAVLDPEVQHAMLRQGVTSIVVGQDGVSFAPSHVPGAESMRSAGAAPSRAAGAGACACADRTPAPHPSSSASASADLDATTWASRYFSAINGDHPTFGGGGVADLLATYDGTTPVNVAYLVPHGTLRYALLGDSDRTATPAERDLLVAALVDGLDAGAVGMSTGLEYVPAAYADREELVALARVLVGRGLPHVSHMRGYEDRAGAAMAELVSIAAETGVATHVSHYHGPAAELAGYVDDALASGLDISFDSYPYLRGASILSMVALPTWLPIADPERTVAALRDPAVLARLRTEHLPGLVDLWPRVTMASVPGEHVWAEGLSLVEVARRLNLSPADTAVELLVSTGLRAGCVFAQPPTNSAASVLALSTHPAQMGGSDAIYAGGRPHPRGWGAFARMLAQVRSGDWTWSEAQHHLSTAAARRFGLAGRGSLEVGSVADVALVDPGTVRDLATYDEPRRLATGVTDVVVAGRRVLSDGELTGLTPGRSLRPSTTTTTAPAPAPASAHRTGGRA